MSVEVIVMCIGVIFIIIGFSTATSGSNNALDQDLGLILLIVGVVCIVAGYTGSDIIDIAQAKFHEYNQPK